jgi:hypothetical protein
MDGRLALFSGATFLGLLFSGFGTSNLLSHGGDAALAPDVTNVSAEAPATSARVVVFADSSGSEHQTGDEHEGRSDGRHVNDNRNGDDD